MKRIHGTLAALLMVASTANAAPTTLTTIRHIAFNQGTSRIVYLDDTRPAHPAIQFLDARTGKAEARTELTLYPGQQVMGFTPDGFKLAVLEAKGLGIYHNEQGNKLRVPPVPDLPSPVTRYQPLYPLTNASGSQQLFRANGKPLLHVIHTGSGKLLATIPVPARLQAMGMSADGRTVGWVSGRELQLYDIYQQKISKILPMPATTTAPMSQPLQFSPDGMKVALLPHVLDVKSGKVQTVAGAQGTVLFSSDSQHLLFVKGASLFKYNLQSGQQQAVDLQMGNGCKPLSAYDFSADGKQLLLANTCPDGASIAVLDARSFGLQQRLRP